jgi:hypothetical protein
VSVETISLWPTDFGEQSDLLTPLAILRQQGAMLGEKTKNIVLGRVSTQSEGETFVQRFSIQCAPLGYQTELIAVKHGIDLYPATVVVARDQGPYKDANSPEELKELLKEVFARPKTKKTIASLLAQALQ